VCKYSVRKLEEFLSEEEVKRYEEIQKLLTLQGIEFIKSNIVRGLDYYTGLVFEFTSGLTLAAGGRYDSLFKEVHGKERAAVGGALGVERVIELLSPKEE